MRIPKRIRLIILGVTALVAVTLSTLTFLNVYAAVKGASLSDIAFLLAGDLTTDSKERTTILLVGAGGDNHPGGLLTDSLMVASLHHPSGSISLLSIPRDLWLPDAGTRINRYYEKNFLQTRDSATAMRALADRISTLIGLDIPYYAKIEFPGFVQTVDALGGITLTVPETIVDPLYPCADMVRYCPFSITAGTQFLDGATALQYARSRETTSDFSRSSRQMLILAALKEKASQEGILSSPRKLRAIYDAITQNTATNLSFPEMLALGDFAQDFDTSRLVTANLSYEDSERGGLLIPGNRADFGGAAVLLPADSTLSALRIFADTLSSYPDVVAAALPIEVLNASSLGAVAMPLAYDLYRNGFNATKANNYPENTKLERTAVYIAQTPESSPVLLRTGQALADFLGVPLFPAPPELLGRSYPLFVAIGADYKKLKAK